MSAEEIFIAIRNDIQSLRRFPLSVLRLMRIRRNFISLSETVNTESDFLKAAWWELRNLSIDIHNNEKVRLLTAGTIWHLHNTLITHCIDQDQANKLDEDLSTLKKTLKPVNWGANAMWFGMLVFLLWGLNSHIENLNLRSHSPYPDSLLIKSSTNKLISNNDAHGSFIIKAENIQNPTLNELQQLVTNSGKQLTITLEKDGRSHSIELPLEKTNETQKLGLKFFPTSTSSIKKITLSGFMIFVTLLLLLPINSPLGLLNGPLLILINITVITYFSSSIQSSSLTAFGYLGILISSYYLLSNRWVFTGLDIGSFDQENKGHPEN